jgi:tetraacyldisaccharide 4'-kinase
VVVLSRADMFEPAGRERVWDRVRRVAPEAVFAEAAHVPVGLRSASGATASLDTLLGKPVAAFCAIGNPAGFRHTLEQSGIQPAELRIFPDHHRYTPADVEALAVWAEQLGAAAVTCTHKDLVKLGVDRLGACPLWAVCVEFRFLGGQEAVEGCLQQILAES